MTTWYRLNMAALTWAEAARFSRWNPVGFAYFAGLKLIRAKGPMSYAFQRMDVPHVVGDDDLAPSHRESVHAAELRLAQAAPGFKRISLYRPISRGAVATVASLWLSPDGITLAGLFCTRSLTLSVVESCTVWVAFFGELENGLRVVTVDQPRKLESESGADVVHVPRADVRQLLDAHRDHATRLGRTSRSKAWSEDQALAFMLAHEQRSHDFHAARGLYVPATVEEMLTLGA